MALYGDAWREQFSEMVRMEITKFLRPMMRAIRDPDLSYEELNRRVDQILGEWTAQPNDETIKLPAATATRPLTREDLEEIYRKNALLPVVRKGYWVRSRLSDGYRWHISTGESWLWGDETPDDPWQVRTFHVDAQCNNTSRSLFVHVRSGETNEQALGRTLEWRVHKPKKDRCLRCDKRVSRR